MFHSITFVAEIIKPISINNNTYTDLVKQTFNFPQEDFKVKNDYLQFNGLDVKSLIDKYGTPMKLTYLPKIGIQINKAKKMFEHAFKKHKYEGQVPLLLLYKKFSLFFYR